MVQAKALAKKPRAATATKSAAPASPAAAVAVADPPANGDLAVAPSLTAALPVAMARLLNPGALRDSAPAQTVIEVRGKP